MKGIILAGGSGTRLYPLTIANSKQLMPVYDKPMIYYPLSTLLEAEIYDILIITTEEEQHGFIKLLGDGSQIGCRIRYSTQKKPEGLAQAFIIGEEFIGNDSVALILGDNIFYGTGLGELLKKCKNPEGALIFAYQVTDPERYGVVTFNKNKKVISIEEKPKKVELNSANHKNYTNYAIPGLYFFDNNVIKYAKILKPSLRGEYEITDINKIYLENNKLKVEIMDRGTAWLDTGTFESLHNASEYIRVIEQRQGISIGCIEEIAYKKGLIDTKQLLETAKKYGKSGYGDYLLSIID